MELNLNEGNRPSKLELGRYVAGELSPDEAAALEARLDDDARAWVAASRIAPPSLAAFDAAALRARATATEVRAAPTLPAAANRGWIAGLVLLAAAFLAVVVAGWPEATVDPDYVGVRGAAVRVHVVRDGAPVPWDGAPVGAGDVLGFHVDATGHRGVVLLSVDGDGQVSVFWPEAGDAPEPLAGSGLVALPGSVVLDGARGPEVFLAVFDTDPATARARAEAEWQSGGAEGLRAWASGSKDVDAVVMERR